MGAPLTKTITLVWDGIDWRDQNTGVIVTGVVKPYAMPINDVMRAIEDIAERAGWPCFDCDRGDDNFSMQFKLGGL